MQIYKPVLFTRKNEKEESQFLSYRKTNNIFNTIDEYGEAATESYLLKNPQELFSREKPKLSFSDSDGIWVCFPWKNTVVHTLSQAEYDAVRLSRNNALITPAEQQELRSKHIVVAGLNVGNPAALCMVQEGIGSTFKFADNDALGLSNLNRFRAGLADIGLNKATLSARQAYEIDPFIDITVYPDGVDEGNLSEFVANADLLVEEMDNLPLKIAIREEAKKQKVPTVMITGNGAGVILDIERFDMEPDLEILSGHLDQKTKNEILQGGFPPQVKLKLAQDFMGEKNLTQRLNDSFTLVGKSLIGIPQLAEASFLRGAVLTSAIRAILTKQPLSSGRYFFQLSEVWGINT